MTDAPELLPCPFCGSCEGLYFTAGQRVQCICQDPSPHPDPDRDAERQKGERLWNTRADLVPRWQPIETAPKGSFRTVRAGEKGVREVHEPVQILAPTSDGKVTLTQWLPKEERWEMFSKKAPPTQWMPLPDPPQ